MTSGFSSLVLLLVLTSSVASATVASAQAGVANAETRTLARDLAQQGALAFEQHDYSVALDRFSRAHALFPAPSLSVMRARSLRRLGRLVEAADAYAETERTPLTPDAPEVFRRAVAEAKQEGLELDRSMPRLLLRVVSDQTDGHVVRLNGKAVPGELLDVERLIDPGNYEIVASAPGCEPIVRHVRIGESERLTVELPLIRGALGKAASSSQESRNQHQTGVKASVTWAYVASGVGLASIALGTVTGVVALNRKSSLDAICRAGCPADSAAEIDSFRTNRTVSYTTFALGTAALGIGAYLLLSGSPDSEGVSLAVRPGALSVRGRF